MRFLALVVVLGITAAIFNVWFLALLMVFLTLLATAVYLVPRKF
jgi:hypothetical protein